MSSTHVSSRVQKLRCGLAPLCTTRISSPRPSPELVPTADVEPGHTVLLGGDDPDGGLRYPECFLVVLIDLQEDAFEEAWELEELVWLQASVRRARMLALVCMVVAVHVFASVAVMFLLLWRIPD